MAGRDLSVAATHDDEALAVLVRAYHDRIHRYGLRVCRDGFDADDAIQEAFTRLARRPDVIEHPGRLAWLMRVVRNACLRMIRPLSRERQVLGQRAVADEHPAVDAPDTHAALERWELVRAVHAAIASLDPADREIIVLRDLEGLTGDEACAVLGVAPAAMKSRLHRARTRLRECLRHEVQR
jgi:RNA polymerase sigma-70 factor (ECF subfamily)